MGLENLVQKAFYLGVGLASYAGEKAGGKLGEFSAQTLKAIEELVARGELTTDEARRMVESLINQQPGSDPDASSTPASSDATNRSPRPIEILSDAEIQPTDANSGDPDISRLRREAQTLQEKLNNLHQSQDP